MPVRLSGKDIVKALGKAGWELERVIGSHQVMRQSDGRHVSVPVAPVRSRLERSHRSAARLAAPRPNCATFFKQIRQSVSLSLAWRRVNALADTPMTWNNSADC
jgi:predicted RNA binding protein YcfA (HicA-like mRNA interferase family)